MKKKSYSNADIDYIVKVSNEALAEELSTEDMRLSRIQVRHVLKAVERFKLSKWANTKAP